jgi:hypothetical protein
MREEQILYKKKIQSFQMSVLVIQVLLLVIGGCVIVLGVQSRPILRIALPEARHHVQWILDMMFATGICQLGMAGFDCFTACWKLIWPIYLGIALTALTICLGLGAIGTSLHLLHVAESFANEDVVHPWYWVECQTNSNCHQAMLTYIYNFILPQIILSSTAIFLQCFGIYYLGRIVKAVAQHAKTIEGFKVWYREQLDNPDGPSKGTVLSPPSHIPPPPKFPESKEIMTPEKENESEEEEGFKQIDVDVDVLVKEEKSTEIDSPAKETQDGVEMEMEEIKLKSQGSVNKKTVTFQEEAHKEESP